MFENFKIKKHALKKNPAATALPAVTRPKGIMTTTAPAPPPTPDTSAILTDRKSVV